MRIIANFHKGEELRFISHLDVMRLLQRAMRRARLPLAFSQGFNPHPILAFASALAVGHTSDAEWMDVQLTEAVDPDEFVSRLNAQIPEGLRVRRALEIDEKLPTLTALLQRAEYEATVLFAPPVGRAALEEGIKTLAGGPIVVLKHTKSGMKNVDIRPQLLSLSLGEADEDASGDVARAVLCITGKLSADGGLQTELLLRALLSACGAQGSIRVHRKFLYFDRIEV